MVNTPLGLRTTFPLPIGWRGEINGTEVVIVDVGKKGSVAFPVDKDESFDDVMTAFKRRGAVWRRSRRNSRLDVDRF